MFLFYALDGRRRELLNLVHPAGHGTGVLATDRLKSLPIEFPELPDQERIASVLGALDDLIETNQVLARRLAQMAKVAGQSFLISVAGRESAPLSRFGIVTKGFSYKSAELVEGSDTLINLKNMGRGGIFERRGFKPLTSDRYKESQVVRPGEVVVSMTDLTQNRDVVARPIRVPDVAVAGRMVASLDLAILRPINGFSNEFLAAVLAQEDFHEFALGYCNGTTVVHMSAKAFEDYRLPAVTAEEAAPVASALSALNAQEDACMAEVADLSRTRDELLPLLMSGKVRVADAQAV
jgi:type I restriction enzyme S subunit